MCTLVFKHIGYKQLSSETYKTSIRHRSQQDYVRIKFSLQNRIVYRSIDFQNELPQKIMCEFLYRRTPKNLKSKIQIVVPEKSLIHENHEPFWAPEWYFISYLDKHLIFSSQCKKKKKIIFFTYFYFRM